MYDDIKAGDQIFTSEYFDPIRLSTFPFPLIKSDLNVLFSNRLVFDSLVETHGIDNVVVVVKYDLRVTRIEDMLRVLVFFMAEMFVPGENKEQIGLSKLYISSRVGLWTGDKFTERDYHEVIRSLCTDLSNNFHEFMKGLSDNPMSLHFSLIPIDKDELRDYVDAGLVEFQETDRGEVL